MKVWISKYALTKGIYEAEGNLATSDTTYFSVEGEHCLYSGKAKQWHTSEESAVTEANRMRLDKIESLKRQIVKLEKTKFHTASRDNKSKCLDIKTSSIKDIVYTFVNLSHLRQTDILLQLDLLTVEEKDNIWNMKYVHILEDILLRIERNNCMGEFITEINKGNVYEYIRKTKLY